MVVFDLDGTLSIVGDRKQFLKQLPKDWDSFFEACDEDAVNKPIADIFRLLKKSSCEIKIVTGRFEKTRGKTMNWLIKNDLSVHHHDLHMRPDGDTRHDTLVKPELIANFINDVEMVFEDRNSMVNKWREMGIICLQVAEGDF